MRFLSSKLFPVFFGVICLALIPFFFFSSFCEPSEKLEAANQQCNHFQTSMEANENVNTCPFDNSIFEMFSALNPGQRVLHIVSHTHWDREWYLSLEQMRPKLVFVLDEIMERLSNAMQNKKSESKEAEFRHFHVDGQLVPILDYLDVRMCKL